MEILNLAEIRTTIIAATISKQDGLIMTLRDKFECFYRQSAMILKSADKISLKIENQTMIIETNDANIPIDQNNISIFLQKMDKAGVDFNLFTLVLNDDQELDRFWLALSKYSAKITSADLYFLRTIRIEQAVRGIPIDKARLSLWAKDAIFRIYQRYRQFLSPFNQQSLDESHLVMTAEYERLLNDQDLEDLCWMISDEGAIFDDESCKLFGEKILFKLEEMFN